jgi:hypothetical protein
MKQRNQYTKEFKQSAVRFVWLGYSGCHFFRQAENFSKCYIPLDEDKRAVA